jgi:hypothetical protein
MDGEDLKSAVDVEAKDFEFFGAENHLGTIQIWIQVQPDKMRAGGKRIRRCEAWHIYGL